jgi:signal transduction histidine kinase
MLGSGSEKSKCSSSTLTSQVELRFVGRVQEIEENCSKQMMSKLEESEVRRVEKLLEEADSYRIRETVTGPTNITVDIQSKTEQVWVVVVGAEVETVSSMVGLLHNK